MKLLSIPNLFSLARLPLAAAFLIADSTLARILIVAVVALTDMLDGYLARRMKHHDRRAGAIIDPITDKLFVLIALIAFLIRGDISYIELLLLLLRDLYTTIAFLILKSRGWRIDFKARLSGKTVTVLQLATLFALLFKPSAVQALILFTAVMSVVAIVDYTQVALRQRRSLAARGAGE